AAVQTRDRTSLGRSRISDAPFGKSSRCIASGTQLVLCPGHPRLVVAGRLRAAALRQGRAGRALRARCAGQVRPVRLLPGPGLVRFLGRRRVHRMVHPAVPGRTDLRGFRLIVVDHPAALEAERRIDLAALGAVVAVAEFILADELAVKRGPHLRAERLAVPPGEEAREEGFDFHCVCGAVRCVVIASSTRESPSHGRRESIFRHDTRFAQQPWGLSRCSSHLIFATTIFRLSFSALTGSDSGPGHYAGGSRGTGFFGSMTAWRQDRDPHVTNASSESARNLRYFP